MGTLRKQEEDRKRKEEEERKEKKKIRGLVEEVEERLKRLSMISKERGEVLKELKDKVLLVFLKFPPPFFGVYKLLIIADNNSSPLQDPIR